MAPPRNLAADLMNILMHSPKAEEAYGEYLSGKPAVLAQAFAILMLFANRFSVALATRLGRCSALCRGLKLCDRDLSHGTARA